MIALIIVCQTSHAGYMACKEMLGNLGLTENKDFEMWDFEPTLSHCFGPGVRQLFITGTLFGSTEGVAEMVQAARDYNGELVTMSFSTEEVPGPFDHSIEKKSHMRKNFQKAVKGFLEGRINRTDVRWTPPPKKLGSYGFSL